MSTRRIFTTAITVGVLAIASVAAATNGMYLPGYGPETTGRGGANLAISDRSLAINFNPAGISQLQGNHLSASVSVLAPQLQFSNLINEEFDGEDRYFPMPSFAYVRGGSESRLTYGIGFVAQGGMGATFENMNTFFGNQDETSTEIKFMTLTPTIAWSLNDDMAIGATWNLGYADASFSFFPNTSAFNPAAPEMSFFGVDMKKAGGFQQNLRVGWRWQADPAVSFGVIYQTKTDATFDGGEMEINFENHPFLGRRVMYEAEMEGFTFAGQAGAGIAIRPHEDWVLAFDLKRYFWDDAIDTIEVNATNPDVAGAPEQVVLPFVFDWKDQWVVAVGADYRVNDVVTLRGGYNFGENPVPDATLTPLFPATTEHHVTGGMSWLRGRTTYEFAIEHAIKAEETNLNQDPLINPFGPGASVSHAQWTFSFGVSWAWARN